MASAVVLDALSEVGLPPLLSLQSDVWRTHPSNAGRPHYGVEAPRGWVDSDYERKAHVGDAFLNLELALLIDKQYPRLVVEARSSVKSSLVETTALSVLADRYKLPDQLIAAPTQEYILRRDDRVKASLFQAYLAGLYAEHGANALTSFVSAIYTPVLGSMVEALRSSAGTISLIPCAVGQALPLPPVVIEPNYVGLLGEWAVARRTYGRNVSYGPPTRLGADHLPTWIVTCEVKQRGVAGTKTFQAAAQSVAKAKSA